MKIETAKQIVEAAQVIGADVTLREGYSGRGMYGRTTAGIVGDRTSIIKATAYAAYATGAAGHDVDGFIDDLDFSWDSMGRDEIAY
jgi:hypothetical protein